MKQSVLAGLVGALFGFTLSRVGFTSWDQVHDMFAFRDPRLILVFASAIPLLGVSWLLIRRFSSPRWTPRDVHPGTLAGGVIFGVGWALSGACPSIALVQLGEGQVGALWTLVGIFAGNYLYSVVHERYFRWSPGVCIE